MKNAFLAITIATSWVFLTGEFGFISFTEGLVIGIIIMWLLRAGDERLLLFRRIWKGILLFFYFLKELALANLKVAYDILTPKHKMKPGIVAVPLSAETDLEITLLANFITLTPGTLSLDVASDNSVLYVHGMYIEDEEEFIREIKEGFEKRLLEVLR